MLSPEAIVAAAAGAVIITHAAFHWSAARSIRRAADVYIAQQLARARALADRPNLPLPPRRPPDWARDTTLAMPLVPPPPGGLSGPTRNRPTGG